MRNVGIFLLCIFAVGNECPGKSLLVPQKFPKTFNDASFTERMDVLAQGYEPWESEFDASGRCIRGCAYAGITIEDELSAMRRKTEQVIAELQAAGKLPSVGQNVSSTPGAPIKPYQVQNVPSTPGVPIKPYQGQNVPSTSGVPIKPYQGQNVPSTSGAPIKPQQSQNVPSTSAEQIVQAVSCKPNQPNISVDQALPLGEPVLDKPRISSPFGRRKHPVTGKMHNHSGVDLAVPRGTNVFSPANGTVENVWRDDTCGRGVRIRHVNGYETVYCHLDGVTVSTGDTVMAGCQIAVSGNTGRSTGPHLHYAIKKDGTYIDPAPLMGR